jgi:hypothetical protein
LLEHPRLSITQNIPQTIRLGLGMKWKGTHVEFWKF